MGCAWGRLGQERVLGIRESGGWAQSLLLLPLSYFLVSGKLIYTTSLVPMDIAYSLPSC